MFKYGKTEEGEEDWLDHTRINNFNQPNPIVYKDQSNTKLVNIVNFEKYIFWHK